MTKPQITNRPPPICLTIAGVDPSGGAGIIADIKTFLAFNCFATAAIASLTFQNTQGVFGAVHQTAETVRNQVLPILDDFEVKALKTGMLPTQEIIEEIADIVAKNKLQNFVVDPVVRSTSGFDLIDDEALKSLTQQLFPLSSIITPNIPEAERIAAMKIKNESDIEKAARKIQDLGAKNVLIKGGHFDKQKSKSKRAKDFLFLGEFLHIFEAEFYETTATHGTGCTLAAAIAANLALGKTLVEAVEIAKRFVNEAIKNAPHLGRGFSPIGI
jgi:hydroxymethylpyrimidine kinase/phosphomethylpyrimidine kinase